MDAILEQFLSEARENLSYLDENLQNLKDGDEETINALFRAAHTLKGGAGLVGFNSVKEVTHAAEDLLDAYRKNEIEFKEELVDTLYDAFDEVIELIDAAEEIGSIDVEVDEEKIENIKNEIRAFLNQDEKSDKIEASFEIVEELPLSNLFTPLQISKLSKDLPIKTPKIDSSFLENENYYLVEFDLDRDVLELGNDPIYLFYLLGEDATKAVAVKINECKNLKESPLEWVSYIVAVIKADSNTIVDSFYNVIDDLRFTPFSIEKLFDSSYENLNDDSLIGDFKEEMISIYKNEEFELLDEKLNAILQIINPNTKDGFILQTLQAVLQNYKPTSNEYKEIVSVALKKLEWGATKLVDSIQTPKIDDKAKQNALNILKAQLKVIELSRDDSIVARTKLLLSNVLGFLNLEEGLSSVSNKEELKTLIKQKITLLNGSDEKTTTKAEKTEIQKSQNKPISQPSKPKIETSIQAHHISKTVKIDQADIDEMMDIVGEILVMKNALPYIANNIKDEYVRRELISKYEQISRVTDRLQDKVMGMRLLPLEFIFGRYPKLVRDLSKKLNKKIKYIEEGKETKLDKTVIEKLADPMIHIIRNSLDHGLETEEERIKKGKNPEGILKISAKSEGDKVIISIEDDGRGIDVEKVVNKALEMRLVDADKIDSMTKEEKLKLLFEPGLSTKEEVTELSGRGVGTDAVKKVIEELGGEIHIESEKDKGTKTIFILPLSVALTNIFHVKMNNVNYAIAMDYVVETEKVEVSEIQTAAHKPFIRMRGELIPILFEEVLLGRSEANSNEISIVVIQNQDQKFGLVVDEFIGQLDIVQKPLTGAFENHPFITGTSLLGNGDVIFVIDPRKVVK